jgi:class 3 adenylate cyclase
MQRVLKTYNADKVDEEKVLLCVGLGFGKMLRIGDTDVFGAEVNAASKLGEDTSKAWEILVTEAVKERAGAIPEIVFEEIDDIPPGAGRAYRALYSLD